MGFIPQVVLFLLGNDGLSLEVFSFGWLGFKKPCIASLQNEAAMQEAADEPWEDELPATVAPGFFESVLQNPDQQLEDNDANLAEVLRAETGEELGEEWDSFLHQQQELEHYASYYSTHYMESTDGSSLQETEEHFFFCVMGAFLLD